MIDRRMINGFLINFVNPSSPPQVKTQMLDAMSKILDFSDDEKKTLGLKTSGKASAQMKSENFEEYGGISEKLIKFFLQDDE